MRTTEPRSWGQVGNTLGGRGVLPGHIGKNGPQVVAARPALTPGGCVPRFDEGAYVRTGRPSTGGADGVPFAPGQLCADGAIRRRRRLPPIRVTHGRRDLASLTQGHR